MNFRKKWSFNTILLLLLSVVLFMPGQISAASHKLTSDQVSSSSADYALSPSVETSSQVVLVSNGPCKITLSPPENVPDKLASNAIVATAGVYNCDSSRYQSFRVCLKKVRRGWRDKEVRCSRANGKFESRSLSAVGCAKPGSYFTEMTLNGRKYSSQRVWVSCRH